MIRRSRFVFGPDLDLGTEFACGISTRPWIPVDQTIGGARTSAAGIPASYVVRRDNLLDLPLRFYESEWQDLKDLLAAGQGAELIRWFPESDDPFIYFDVWLESPKAGDTIRPTRDSEYPRAMELTITIRGQGAEAPWLEYFDG